MKFRIALFAVSLAVLSFLVPAYPDVNGLTTIKIISPTPKSIVMVDDIALNVKPDGQTFIKSVDPGEHYVSVTLDDGTEILNESVYCNVGQETVVTVPNDETSTVDVTSSIFESPFSNDEVSASLDEANDTGTGEAASSGQTSSSTTSKLFESPFDEGADKKPGDEDAKYGISIGGDDSNFQTSLGSANFSTDIGGQGDLSLFYDSAMDDGMFLELSFSALRSKGSYVDDSDVKTELTAYPIMLDLKYRIADGIYFGAGLNYSYWSYTVADVATTVSGAFGYQACLDIRPLSSEIGYIIKKGLITTDNGDENFTSAGLYYMYKIYFNI